MLTARGVHALILFYHIPNKNMLIFYACMHIIILGEMPAYAK